MYHKILIPTDGSISSRKALCTALNLASITNGKITLFHATSPPQSYVSKQFSNEPPITEKELIKIGQKAIDDTLRDIDIEGAVIKTKVVIGYPLKNIIAETYDQNIDLIIMGSQGKHSDQPKIGNLVKGVVEQAPCPVLLVLERAACTL